MIATIYAAYKQGVDAKVFTEPDDFNLNKKSGIKNKNKINYKNKEVRSLSAVLQKSAEKAWEPTTLPQKPG
jgi:hypothetical protein